MVQYVILFLVILAVMAVMNGFLFLMLRSLARQLKEQVGACFLRQMEFADELYEEKAVRLAKLREEEEMYLGRATAGPLEKQLAKEEAAPGMREVPAQAPAPLRVQGGRRAGYINPNLIRDYRYIKENFRIDTGRAYADVMKEPVDPRAVHYGDICRHMYEVLDFDTVYQVGLLPVEQQHEILYEIFDDEEDAVLRSYVEQHPDFLIVDFRDYLRMEAEMYQDRTVVLAADPAFAREHPEAEVRVDESLGEGIRVLRGSRMYDYSI